MPPAHPTVIDEAMASESVIESAAPSSDIGNVDCSSLRVHDDLILTQMVEEGLEDADEDDNDDLI